MQLVIKSTDNDGRLEPIGRFVTTPWTWIVADHRDDAAFARALGEADAIVTMNWPATFPPAPRLRPPWRDGTAYIMVREYDSAAHSWASENNEGYAASLVGLACSLLFVSLVYSRLLFRRTAAESGGAP